MDHMLFKLWSTLTLLNAFVDLPATYLYYKLIKEEDDNPKRKATIMFIIILILMNTVQLLLLIKFGKVEVEM